MGINDGMSTSKNGLEFISKWEGCILKPYKDIAGLRTIGVGHLIKPGENFPDGVEITKEKALEILANDVKLCEDSIKARIKVPLNQNQFDALVSFGFNCGTGVYTLSDACKALNEGKYEEFPQRILVWSKAKINGVLQTNQGLYNRRKSEGELFSRSVAEKPVEPVKMVNWTKESLTEAQTVLAKLGLYTAKIDGLWGPSTSTALVKFAESKNVKLNTTLLKSDVPDSLLALLTALKSS
jgi:lysozyme